jgi:hypothetical protein
MGCKLQMQSWAVTMFSTDLTFRTQKKPAPIWSMVETKNAPPPPRASRLNTNKPGINIDPAAQGKTLQVTCIFIVTNIHFSVAPRIADFGFYDFRKLQTGAELPKVCSSVKHRN